MTKSTLLASLILLTALPAAAALPLPAGEGVAAAGGAGLALPVQWREDRSPGTIGHSRQVTQTLQTGSLRFRRDVAVCVRPGDTACVADALDDYADWLEGVERTAQSVIPVAVPAIRKAAREVRAARSGAEARQAVAGAAETIAKTIALVRAGEDDTFRRLEILQRNVVLQSLAAADAALVKVVGI